MTINLQPAAGKPEDETYKRNVEALQMAIRQAQAQRVSQLMLDIGKCAMYTMERIKKSIDSRIELTIAGGAIINSARVVRISVLVTEIELPEGTTAKDYQPNKIADKIWVDRIKAVISSANTLKVLPLNDIEPKTGENGKRSVLPPEAPGAFASDDQFHYL
jgi:hypothetical protein